MNLSLLAQAAPDATFWQSNGMGVLGIWVSVGFTLALYTFLYRDNPVFKFAEHVYVGVTNGYLLWQAWLTMVKPELVLPLGRLIGHAFRPDRTLPDGTVAGVALQDGDTWWLLVPAALSVFMLLRFVPKAAWLSRWSFAFIVATAAGTLVPLYVKAQIFSQMGKMLESPIMFENVAVMKNGVAVTEPQFTVLGTVSALLLLGGVISVLTYFIFSVEHKGPVRRISRVGVVFLMIAFGAHFGYTVMGRESLLIGRVQFLLDASRLRAEAEGSPNPWCATPVLLLLVVAAVAAVELARLARRKSEEREAGSPSEKA